MTLPRYPAYRNSGVTWLGMIPSHWRLVRLQDVAKVINGFPFDSALFDESAGHPLIRIRDLDGAETATRYRGDFLRAAEVFPGDILIGMDGDFNVGRWLGRETALLNQRMCCVRAENEALTIFLRHALPIPLKAINDITYSTTVKHLSSLDVQKIRFGLPDDQELTAIAAFLDRETTKIDALIAEQEKLIALLAEKRQATISHAVTRGLDPDAPMKGSGVSWLGEVPAHWSVSALSYVASIETGSTPDRGEPAYWNGSIPWLKTGEVNWLPIRDAEEFITEAGFTNSAAKVSPPGTLLMAMYGQGVTRGRVALLEIHAAYNQACAAIQFGPRVRPEFAKYFFMAAYEHVRDAGNETSQMNLSSGLIAKIRLPIPPGDEQSAVVEHLDRETAKLDVLQAEARRSIALLAERRSALITAAVTGQIDVRGLAPAPSAAVPEETAA